MSPKFATLPVTGMHCAACAAFIERNLKKIPGVQAGEVNYGTEKLKLTWDPEAVGLEDLAQKVQSWGYGLVLPRPEETGKSGASPEEIKAREREDLKKKVEASLPLALVVFFMMMWDLGHQTWGWPGVFLPMKLLDIFSFFIATVVVFWAGRQFLLGVLRFFAQGQATMDTLVGLGTFTAYIYSSFLLFFPEVIRLLGLPDHSFFDAAIVVTAFVLLGKYMEARSKEKTGQAIRSLLELQAKTAVVLRDSGPVEIPLDQVRRGDRVLIKSGSKVSVDGVVLEGASGVDESLITGESLPVMKTVGDRVVGGSMNTTGALVVEAQNLGSESFLSQIIALVDQAQGSKAPVQALADKISGVFVPVVLGIAGLTFLTWVGISAWQGNLQEGLALGMACALAVLVIACPCALGLATPTAVVVGVGRGARAGILIQDAQALEASAQVDTVVLDKTGTLTQGKPQVEALIPSPGISENEVLALAGALESGSEHPLALAVLTACQKKDLTLPEVKDFENLPGQGVRARHPDRGLLTLGSLSEAQNRMGLPIPEAQALADRAMTLAVLSSETEVLGILGIRDPLKPEAPEVVKALKHRGLHIVLLTGDHQATAQALAREAGIEEVYAQVLPGDKAAKVKDLQAQGRRVAMVGDGVNDAPALAQAQVGIAMATGTDAAIQSAGITLLGGDLRRLVGALILGKKTLRVIRQNLFWAFIYNLAGIPLAAGLLYPWTGWLLSPVFAGAAMALSSVSVVSNSLRLRAAGLQEKIHGN